MKPASVLLLFLMLSPALRAQTWSLQTGAEVRGRFESRDNRDFSDIARDKREDALFRIRLSFRFDNKPYGLTFFFQPQDSIDRLTLPGAGSLGNDVGTHQLYMDWRPAAAKRWTLRGGRQELAFGNARLIGPGNWDNIGRSFDGFRATYAGGAANVSAFATQLGQAAAKTASPRLYGVYGTLGRQPANALDLFALYKRDRVSGVGQHVYTAGGRTHRVFRQGLDVDAEAAWQWGTSGGRGIEAWACALNAGWTARARCSPRIGVEYDAASGGDPADSRGIHTFDQLFPTSHAKHGVADYQGWRNMRDLRVTLSARPRPGLSVNADHLWFWLQDARDFWYGASGRPNQGTGGKPLRDPTGGAGTEVGRELDLYASYAPSPMWSFDAGYAHFMPGRFIRQVNGRADASDFWYVQAAWRPR